jgi:hypothetical protein
LLVCFGDFTEKSSAYQAIQCDGQSQKLSKDDVDSLKSQGKAGKVSLTKSSYSLFNEIM